MIHLEPRGPLQLGEQEPGERLTHLGSARLTLRTILEMRFNRTGQRGFTLSGQHLFETLPGRTVAALILLGVRQFLKLLHNPNCDNMSDELARSILFPRVKVESTSFQP